ncbi:MAG: DNRLRE domain-containing protein [Pirellulales bacterium]
MRFRHCSILFCACAAMVFVVENCHAVVLTPTQDAFVFSGAPDDNFNNDLEGLLMTDGVRVPWIQWDLSTLPDGATINSAHIELFLFSSSDTNDSEMTYQGYTSLNETDSFDETTITWNTVPADGPTIDLGTFTGVIAANAPESNLWYTSLPADSDEIQLLQSITEANGSFVYQFWGAGVTGSHHRYFVDREGNHNNILEGDPLRPELAPRLVIDYTSTTIDGDFNGDGGVDAADYVVWRKELGDVDNYELWRTHFGTGTFASGAGAVAAAPEPTTIATLGIVLGMRALIARRRARGSRFRR